MKSRSRKRQQKLTQIIEQNSLRHKIASSKTCFSLPDAKETSSKVLDLNLYLTQFKQQFQSHQADIQLSVHCQKDTQVFRFQSFATSAHQPVLNAARYAKTKLRRKCANYSKHQKSDDLIYLDISDNGGGKCATTQFSFRAFYTSENNGHRARLVRLQRAVRNQPNQHSLSRHSNGNLLRLLLQKKPNGKIIMTARTALIIDGKPIFAL